MEQEATPNQIHVAAGYGANTRQPFVSLRVRDVAVMMSPEEAQEIARNLMQAAEAALSDMFIVDWITEHVGGTLEQAAGLLHEFRAVRQKREER